MRRKFRLTFAVAIACAVCFSPTRAGANGTIQNVLVEPSPVETTTDVTITTDFQMSNAIVGFESDVTKTATTVTVDICVELNELAVIDSDTSVDNVGTFPPGEVTCLVRLFDGDSGDPCASLRDTVSCDFIVTATAPALSSWGRICLGALVLGIASYALAGRRIA